MDLLELFHNAWIIAIGIIGFFLKTVHSDLKEVIKDTQDNKQKIQLLSMESAGKLDQLKETTELQIQALTKAVDELAKTTSNMQKTMMHFNKNYKHSQQGLAELLKELLDKND